MKEKESPGCFQFIIDEMFKANGLHKVKFPQSVISGLGIYPPPNQEQQRKRHRQEEEEEEVEIMEGATALVQIPSLESLIDQMQQPIATPTPANTPITSPD